MSTKGVILAGACAATFLALQMVNPAKMITDERVDGELDDVPAVLRGLLALVYLALVAPKFIPLAAVQVGVALASPEYEVLVFGINLVVGLAVQSMQKSEPKPQASVKSVPSMKSAPQQNSAAPAFVQKTAPPAAPRTATPVKVARPAETPATPMVETPVKRSLAATPAKTPGSQKKKVGTPKAVEDAKRAAALEQQKRTEERVKALLSAKKSR